MKRATVLPATLAAALVTSGCATPFYMGQQPTTEYGRSGGHMPEHVRKSIGSVSVHAGTQAPTLYVGGDYGATTPTAGDGAKEGAMAGVGVTGEMVAEDPRALILVPIVLPFAVVTGSIVGATAAKVQEQIREFRDELTDEMLDESNPELPSTVLAQELKDVLGAVDAIRVTDAGDADASLTITLTEVAIELDGDDADMSATAYAVLRDRDGRVLYDRSFDYRDRDSLRNWSADDNALWRQFTNNARQYLARRTSERLFETITTRHVLRPTGNDWDRRAKSATPTLGWDFVLLGGDDYDGTDIADNPIRYDLEVYDGSRLVYFAQDIPENQHTVTVELPRCTALSWSVRPVFEVEGRTRTGEWMRRASATERMMQTPGVTFTGGQREYWDSFAEIKTRCGK